MEDVEVLGAQINLMIKQIGNFSQALCHIFEEWHDLKYITWCGSEVYLRTIFCMTLAMSAFVIVRLLNFLSSLLSSSTVSRVSKRRVSLRTDPSQSLRDFMNLSAGSLTIVSPLTNW